MLKCGGRWANCPPEYGPSTTVYNRWNQWSRRGIWTRILAALTEEGWIAETGQIDSSYIKAHRSAGGAKRMARPVGKRRFDDGLISLQKRIRPFGSLPLAKMEIRAFWSS